MVGRKTDPISEEGMGFFFEKFPGSKPFVSFA